MSAFNIVRMKVKPGEDKAYLDYLGGRPLSDLPGMTSLRIVKTGDREYMFLGEWTSMEAMVAARPAMIATLDEFRDRLEDLGHDLGVTDPRSGEVVLQQTS